MKHQIFKKLKLVLIENNGKFTLYRSANPLPPYGELSHLEVVDFIKEKADYIAVYPECNLIVADGTIYSAQGEKITDCPSNEVKIISKHDVRLITCGSAVCGYRRLILWNGRKILLESEYQNFKVSTFYFAVYTNQKWYVYDWSGNLRNADYLVAKEDILITGHFLVKTGIGNHELYSLKHGSLLRQNQSVILCSRTDDFALCASLNHKLEIFYHGSWRCLENVDYFELLDDVKLFYIQKNGKYSLYRYSEGETFFDRNFPQGMDFISYDVVSQTLLISSGLRPLLMSKEKALSKC